MLNDKDLFNKINSGFSLIELVIVIAVIAILLVVAIPAFLRIREKTADMLVKVSMINSWKECRIGMTLEEVVSTFTPDFGLNLTNGFYVFYQKYDYIPREDGYIPLTIIGTVLVH